jgi:hypothetical protein
LVGQPVAGADGQRARMLNVKRRFRAAPVAAEVGAGGVTLRIPGRGLRQAPSVAGDFSGWRPLRMVRSGEFWVIRLDLAPGAYRYAFRTADGEWFVPDSVPGRRDDGMGGVSALLLVR